MTDFFLFAAPAAPTRDELLKTWAEPEGETQIGRIPSALTPALAAVRDDQLRELAEAWRVQLGDGFEQESLARDLDGLRAEARRALEKRGALWLRIEA